MDPIWTKEEQTFVHKEFIKMKTNIIFNHLNKQAVFLSLFQHIILYLCA